MKTPLLILSALFVAQISFAQFGINAGAHFLRAAEWENAIQNRVNASNSFGTDLYLGVDYWFRLKNRRVEFLPEVSYAQSSIKNNYDFEGNNWDETNTFRSYSFFFNTNLYLLDFAQDCNCPTFSKDGDIIKKGFFVRLAPGVQWIDHSTSFVNTNSNTINEAVLQNGQAVFSLRGGIGLDIGLSDFLTITPLVQANYSFGPTWPYILAGPEQTFPDYEPGRDNLVADDPIQLFVGLRFGFRFDELNKYGYR